MFPVGRRLGTATVVLVCLVGVGFPGVGPVGGALDGQSGTIGDGIERTQELRLTPDRPGEIDVRLTYSTPETLTELTTRLPKQATVTESSGFVRRDGGEYAWDRRSGDPALTYRLSVNRTRDATGPIAADGEYTFVDAGDWALVRVPPVSTSWSWTGDGRVELSRSTTTDGPGAVGGAIAFLGDHREVTRTAHGQTFRLVVPGRATLAESPSSILDSMASASEALQVGDRDESVFAVAAPTGSVEWGVQGLQTGEADMWVRDVDRVDSASNVWIHEYVHTRQGYAADAEVRWFTEASASYYAALLTLEQDRIDFEEFRNRLRLGTRTPDRDAVLSDPTTWDSITPYTKGALVAGDLDRRLRVATARTASLQDVFSRMNARDGAVDNPAFVGIVRAIGDESVADVAERYTTSTAALDTWDLSAHSRAFSTLPARIGYTMPAAGTDGGYRVRGPYRNESLAAGTPIALAPGEMLTFEVQVRNSGGTSGEYDARLLVDGDERSRENGTLVPGDSRTLPFAHRFERTGEFSLSVAGKSIPVSVRRPGTPAVRDLRVERRDGSGRSGPTVDVTATVASEDRYPAAGNLTLLGDGELRSTRAVRVGPERERTVTFEDADLPPGEYVYRLGERSANVTIEAATPTSSSGPGLTASTVLVAIALFVLLFRFSR